MRITTEIPSGISPGVIATELHQPIHRVLHILRTRRHIQPMAMGGIIRLYHRDAIGQVRAELDAIDARRGGRHA